MRENICISSKSELDAYLYTMWICLNCLKPGKCGHMTRYWTIELRQNCHFQSLSNKPAFEIFITHIFLRFFRSPGQTWKLRVDTDPGDITIQGPWIPSWKRAVLPRPHILDCLSKKGSFILLCYWDLEIYLLW